MAKMMKKDMKKEKPSGDKTKGAAQSKLDKLPPALRKAIEAKQAKAKKK